MRIIYLLMTASLAVADTKLPPPANKTIDYDTDVRPLLSQNCYSCHGGEIQQSGLRLDLRQNALRGGDYGPVINPGNSATSKLIRRLVNGDGGLRMPPTGTLSDDEIGILRAWIDQGADFKTTVLPVAPPTPADPKLGPLIQSVRNRDTARAGEIIAASPELVNAHDRAGTTPLQHAAGFGNLATMKLLLDNGADPNAMNKRKSTPLFWALHDEGKVRLLLDRGANVNARTVDGRTPVYQAASMANAVPVLRLLLEHGGDKDAKTLIGMTPLMAAARGPIEGLRLLIGRKAGVNATNAAGATALMAAAQLGKPEAVRLLLESGADPNLRTKKNECALAEAATAGNEETVRLLLDRGAEVNVRDIRGYSPLLYAAGSDTMSVSVVKMLLAKGADTSAEGDGETASMLAAKRGDSEVYRLLRKPDRDRKAVDTAIDPQNNSRARSDREKRSIAAAIKPAFGLLEKQSHNFIRIAGCNSCHAQDLPSAAAAIARTRGFSAPAEIPQLPQSMHSLNAERILDLAVISVAGLGWEMFDFGANGVAGDEYTDATARFLKSMQAPDGHWEAAESRRPPMNAGVYQTTALSVYSLKTYGPRAEKGDTERCIASASAWLGAASPSTTQDRAFHLLGLAWSDSQPSAIAAAAKALAARQRRDGGWNQLAPMESDAYATGQALYALNAAGRMPATDPVYVRGVKYLLGTQAVDGSWHVKSRSIWLQPYFDSGFPYGNDQWISAAGTTWATMALSLTAVPSPELSTPPTRQASKGPSRGGPR